ncbi:hypothetical protein QOZ84_10765 [Romboutsia sedimentorum]|uniref:HNH nuclease domain-containing protein n=1 Tax=Romboutsia sedimentorum TaxID=1368474 RepID=A0ABT7EAS3_9FIRM|nr:hypothetical protein [Romboutsia sedimentorum]MDK2564032.1 hypothetical protein [Romboutsia sedimentorum]MDK2585573.1 hypothetical protein [Romboutsia sedimentorum]
MFIIDNYKTKENKYETQGNVTFINILKKNNTELVAKIDTEDLEKIQAMGTWFAEWHKDFNSYLVQNLTVTKVDKKLKSNKRNIQSVILDTESKAPIKHINGDTLDNRKCNLQLVDRKEKNEYETIDNDTIAVILKDRYGKEQAKALISSKDLDRVVNKKYTWLYHKGYKQPQVIAHTPNGKVNLEDVIMKPSENMRVHHINLNPLDNRRKNLENKQK